MPDSSAESPPCLGISSLLPLRHHCTSWFATRIPNRAESLRARARLEMATWRDTSAAA